MNVESNRLQGLAYNLFAGKELIHEKSEQPIGKMVFGDRDKTGSIDIKALTQDQRALLHFSVTGKIPKGYSLRDLQTAYKGLKDKLSESENILYQRGKGQSFAKRVKHTFEHVIKTAHLYNTIAEREAKLDHIWNTLVEDIDPAMKPKLKKQFDISQKTMKVDELLEMPVSISSIHKTLVRAFKEGEGASGPKGLMQFGRLDSVLLKDSKIAQDLKKQLTRDACKEAFTMSNEEFMAKANGSVRTGVNGAVYYDPKVDAYFAMVGKGGRFSTTKLSAQDQKALENHGELHVINKLRK
jgi:hypothetical protein